MESIESIIGVVFLVLILSYVFSQICKRINIPSIIGPLFAGLIIGLPVVKYFLISDNIENMIFAFSEIGLVFLMFFVGLSLDISSFNKKDKSLIYSVAFGSFFLAFLLGFGFSYFIFDFSLVTSLIIGAALSVTSESVSIDVLKERGLIKSKLSRLILGGGIINDIIGILFIALLVTVFGNTNGAVGESIIKVIINFCVFIGLVYISKYLIIPFSLKIAEKQNKKSDLFVTSIMIALFMAFLATVLGLDSVLGAILGGMLVRYILVNRSKNKGKRKAKHDKIELKDIEELIESITFGYFSLFFFVYIGMQANFGVLIQNPQQTLIYLAIAFIGTIFGSFLASGFAGGGAKKGLLMGIGLNSRDAMGLVIATIAFVNGFIPLYIFNILIFISFTTTIITPFLFDFLIMKNKSLIKRNKL